MKILNLFEKLLPYTIIFPFSYFFYNSVYKVRSSIITDSKQGKIKQTFIMKWLKEIALQKVILKNQEIRKESLIFLQKLVVTNQCQMSSLAMFIKVIYYPQLIELTKAQCDDIFFTVLRQLDLADWSKWYTRLAIENAIKSFFTAPSTGSTTKQIQYFINSIIFK